MRAFVSQSGLGYFDSLDIKIIKRDGRMPTVHYGLKQIKEEDDLNNGIDWDNSDLKNKRRSKTNEKFFVGLSPRGMLMLLTWLKSIVSSLILRRQILSVS